MQILYKESELNITKYSLLQRIFQFFSELGT